MLHYARRILGEGGVYSFSSSNNGGTYTGYKGAVAVPNPINRRPFIDVFARPPKYNRLVKTSVSVTRRRRVRSEGKY
jgi:hypothetical protein